MRKYSNQVRWCFLHRLEVLKIFNPERFRGFFGELLGEHDLVIYLHLWQCSISQEIWGTKAVKESFLLCSSIPAPHSPFINSIKFFFSPSWHWKAYVRASRVRVSRERELIPWSRINLFLGILLSPEVPLQSQFLYEGQLSEFACVVGAKVTRNSLLDAEFERSIQ